MPAPNNARNLAEKWKEDLRGLSQRLRFGSRFDARYPLGRQSLPAGFHGCCLYLPFVLLSSLSRLLPRTGLRPFNQSESTVESAAKQRHLISDWTSPRRRRSAREDRALLNGVECFEALQTFSPLTSQNGNVFARGPAEVGRTVRSRWVTSHRQKASGIGSEGLQVLQRIQKSLEYCTSARRSSAAEYDCGWWYFCFIDLARVRIEPALALAPGKLILCSMIWLLASLAQLVIVLDDLASHESIIGREFNPPASSLIAIKIACKPPYCKSA